MKLLLAPIVLCLLFITSPGFGQNKLQVPLGGNAWVHGGSGARISGDGFKTWSDPREVIDCYVRFNKAGNIKLSILGEAARKSKIRVSIGKKSKTIELKEGEDVWDAGQWKIAGPGYTKVQLQGISKTGAVFGNIQKIQIEGSAVDEQTTFVKDNKDNYFYWGRRGPSVHLTYPLPAGESIEWFYNEITVPEKQDVIGSYYMANGFGEGYFGMQVNSETERRVLFSVWSPFHTDDPKSIPLEMQIKMLGKGSDVHTGEFGNEGSGGQSYLKYNWKAGNTYKFLLHGKPTGDSTTTYSAFFFAPETNQWKLIASFKRPKTHTYLTRFHSFLENFIPEMGDVQRKVRFGNQWVCNDQGRWTELTGAKFTADATARKGFRMDYAGGQEGQFFFLQNCGFFKDYTQINEKFTRSPSGKAPDIDLQAIDQLLKYASKQP